MSSVEALFLLAVVVGLVMHKCGRPSLGAGARTGTPGFQLSPTTGTILVLNFADFIQLAEEYYAPDS